MTTPPVLLAVDGGIARLTLNRPEAGNAMTPQLTAVLREHAGTLSARGDVRVVVLGASGTAFCVGGDLAWMSEQGDDIAAPLHAMATDLHAATEALAALDAPLICAVGGVAAGAGMSLACAGDLVLATASARFAMAYTAAGLSPDGGSTWFLPRIVGVRRATELMLTNRRLSAAEAAEFGIVTRVVEDGTLASEVDALAASIAGGPTPAFGAVKRLLRRSSSAALHEQLAAEADSIAALAASANGREGVAAFLEKRAPQFGG